MGRRILLVSYTLFHVHQSALSLCFWNNRADFMNDEEIQDLIAWKSPFVSIDDEVEFTQEEKDTMLKLPRKQCSRMYYVK